MNAETRLTPAWLEWAYTGFMAVLVPVHWHPYGPARRTRPLTLAQEGA